VDGRSIRLRNPSKVVDEIEHLNSKGIKDIFFVDSLFNNPREHAEKICKEIIKRGIKIGWRANFSEKFIDRDLILLARESGCKLFILGTDGASSRALSGLKKASSFSEVNRVYNLFRSIKKVNFFGTFIFNAPGDGLKSVFDILRLTIPSILTGRFGCHISNMRIYPNTLLKNLAVKRKALSEDADLFLPTYYDPWPLKFISYFINFLQKVLYRVKLSNMNLALKFAGKK